MNRTQLQAECDPDALEHFLQGTLVSGEADALELHLTECESCAEQIQITAQREVSWQDAQDMLGPDQYDSPEQVSAITSLLSGEPDTITKQQTADVLAREIRGWLDPTDDPQSLGRFAGYEIVGIVGHGGMGIVLKGFESSLNRYVAIKVLAPRLATNGNARKRFAREAQAAAAVRHDNVIAIHRVDDWHGLPFLVMPYVGGISLQKRIDTEGSLSIEQTLRVGVQVASGLAAAHAQGLVHRDIKPANILLEQGVERVTITDFGLARAADDASVTRTGVIAGTPQYMSPEQAEARHLDARSDLFSLGSVLYAMATGRPPFRGDSSFEVLKRIVSEPTRSMREIEASVPEWFEQLVARLHSKSADARFDSAEQVADLLEDCLAHVQQPTTTPLPEAVAELAKSFGPHCNAPLTESLGDFRYPPIGKLIAVAAFAFSLVFAGVLIVLELDKGTLTIESEADDVPIRIMRNDKVVDRLMVTESRESVRIASGQYTIAIEGPHDGLEVDTGVVNIVRGDTSIVTVTTTREPDASQPASAAGELKPKLNEESKLSYSVTIENGVAEISASHEVPYEVIVNTVESLAAAGVSKIKFTKPEKDAPDYQIVSVQFNGDAAVLRVSNNTAPGIVQAVIAALQEAGMENFSLRAEDREVLIDPTKMMFSIKLLDDTAEIDATFELDHEYLVNTIKKLTSRGIDQINFTPHPKHSTDAGQGELEEEASDAMENHTAADIVTRPTGDSEPGVGSLIFIKLTGDVALAYAKETGKLRDDEAPPDGLEIETTAEVAQQFSDGRLRIEHLSSPRVVFTNNWFTMLIATVDPLAISHETTPRGTVVSSSPGAAIRSMTNHESQSFRLTISNLDDVVLKTFLKPLPAKEAALSDLQFKRTAAALNHLLQLNGDGTTHIEKVGSPTNFMGIKDVEEIRSHGKDYVVVAARRFPPEVEQPFGKDGDGMIFLFDKKGNLEAKFGGKLGPDGMNAERVQLLSLGTEDQWFVVIHASQSAGPHKTTQEIVLVEDGFPLAFQIHAIKSMAWTSAPYLDFDFGYKHYFNPSGIPTREFGKGHDGKDYHAVLGWDAKERVFLGPSQLTYKDRLLFRVNFTASTRFRAADRRGGDQASVEQEAAFDAVVRDRSAPPENAKMPAPASRASEPSLTGPTKWSDRSPAAKALAKLKAEYPELRAAYSKAASSASGEVEMKRIREELDPHKIMLAKYLAFEEQHRGTDAGLQALVKAGLISRIDRVGSEGVETERVLEHYLDHRGLEEHSVAFSTGVSFVGEDKFLQTLVDKSPHRQTRAAALIAQLIQGKQLLTNETQLPKIIRNFKETLAYEDDDPPQVKIELETALTKLENMDFNQLRSDLKVKLNRLAVDYPDVTVKRYGTGAAAAIRLSHAVNNVTVGAEVPEMTATDINGQEFRLSELRGNIVVLLFGENSGDDYKEMYGPLRSVVAKYSWAPVKFVGIMGNDDPDKLHTATEEGDLNWTVIPEPFDGPLQLDWGISAYPTVYIVDPTGKLQPELQMPYYGAGGYDTHELDDKLAEMLKPSPYAQLNATDSTPWAKTPTPVEGDNSYCLIWESASKVRLRQDFADSLELNSKARTAVDSLLTEIWTKYIDDERDRTTYSQAADGHLVAEIGDLANDRNGLANIFFEKLGKIVSDTQRDHIWSEVKSRSDRAFDEIWKDSSDAYPALLGWSKDNSPIRIEIRETDDGYHWYVRAGSHGVTGDGEKLPGELQHYLQFHHAAMASKSLTDSAE